MNHREKLELMQYGMEPTDAALEALPKNRFGEIVVRDFVTTSGLIVHSPENTYVNAPVTFDSNLPTKYYLDFDDGFRLNKRGKEGMPVEMLPNPEYALENRRLSTGEPARDFVMSHADRIRISPLSGCAFNCRFCSNAGLVYRPAPVEKLDEAFRMALEDPYMARLYEKYRKHALISGGTPHKTLTDYRCLDGVFAHFTSNYPDMDFDLMLAPRTLYPGEHTKRKYRNYLKFLKETGIHTLSVNIELFNKKIRARLAPEKEAIGIGNYLLFLEQAAEIFDDRMVRSILIVGLEPKEDTVAGVAAIAERGCLVELSPFTPGPGTFLAREKKPSVDYLEEVLIEASEMAARFSMPIIPFCKPCSHNIVTL